MDTLLPERFLEPTFPVMPDIDIDDGLSDVSPDPSQYEEILPPQSGNIRQLVIHSMPSASSADATIYLRNPLGFFYLQPDLACTNEHPTNQLVHAIQLEHCKETASVLRGSLLVTELSAEGTDHIVDLPYEHIKYIELIVTLYVDNNQWQSTTNLLTVGCAMGTLLIDLLRACRFLQCLNLFLPCMD